MNLDAEGWATLEQERSVLLHTRKLFEHRLGNRDGGTSRREHA